MRFGSVCSGIDAASIAWTAKHGPMNWSCEFFSEIDKFPSAVLAHHYGSNMPGEPYSQNAIPNYGDMTKFMEWPDHGSKSNRPIDVLVGGTPCQTFSVAGLRAGLADPRGNLMLTYLAILERYKPRWFIWENVPGVLSSNGGKDFGTFLGGVEQCGYGAAYRVLDAQFVRVDGLERAVPQRRRRVFVVGYLGDWRPPAAVLFERESLRGHPAPRRKSGEGFAADVGEGATVGSLCARTGLSRSQLEGPHDTAALRAASGGSSKSYVAQVAPSVSTGPPYSRTGNERVECEALAVQSTAFKIRGGCEGGGKGYLGSDETAFTLSTTHDQDIFHDYAVRRLTPTECQRLQGFPAVSQKYHGAINPLKIVRMDRNIRLSATQWPSTVCAGLVKE